MTVRKFKQMGETVTGGILYSTWLRIRQHLSTSCITVAKKQHKFAPDFGAFLWQKY